METQGSQRVSERVPDRPRGYQPPAVEKVLTPADLEREILYAGVPPAPTPPP